MNQQARIRAAIARHPYDKCMHCGSRFKVEGLVDVREDIPLQRLATAMGPQICRLHSPHSCEAWWSNFKPTRTDDPGRRDAPVAATRPGHQINRPGGSASGPRADGDDEDPRIWQLLDQAIQETGRSELKCLEEGLNRKKDVKLKVESALKSLKLLQTGGEPDYHDPWTAVFYLTWFQPRHVNLIYSHLKRSNERLPQGLRVVDLGCGCSATMFALAVFAATSGQHEARISVHGIDPSRAMRTLGSQLWVRFSKLIRREGPGGSVILGRMNRVIERMSQDSQTGDSWRDMHEETVKWRRRIGRDCTWLTSVHAAYHLPRGRGMRKATLELAPEVMLITAEHSRRRELNDVRRKLHEIHYYSFQHASEQRENHGCLTKTKNWRSDLRERIIDDWGSFDLDWYLDREVRWNPWKPNKQPIVIQGRKLQ